MSARAGVVITGTEVLTGRVRDRNGPWLSDRLFELGIDLAHITICGDRPEDMEAQLAFMAAQGMDVVITSGGLGPTADDLTTEVVARFCGRPMVHDPALEERIVEIVRPLARRWRNVSADALRAGARKQATFPEGAAVLGPAGTAPGLVVPPAGGSGPTVVVLPGPPRELHALWAEATATPEFAGATGGRSRFTQRTVRLYGMPESEIAETLRVAEGRVEGLDRLEVTTCLRRGEVEVVTRFEPDADDAWQGLLALIGERHPDTLFSPDGSRIDDQIAGLLAGRRLALAESCTGGLLAARITEVAGSSAYFVGGAVTYADEAKQALLGVPEELIRRHGAVSPPVADAMAAGALERFDADTAIAVTGVAGPDGGTEDKPVGYVCWSVRTAEGGGAARDFRLPGDRAEIRDRSTTVALHLLREILTGVRAAA